MNTFTKIAISILLQIVLVYTTFSQPTSLYFQNLSIGNGLPSNTINSIVQDESGFIWIGTEEGLCRYDAYSIKTFKYSGQEVSIPSNRISCLYLENNLLWVGTWNGICTINILTFEITPVNIGENSAIRAIQKDNDDWIWIGTGNGLIHYNKTDRSYKVFTDKNSKLSHNTIRCFYKSGNGDLWIGTFDKLNRYRDGQFETFDLKGNYKSLIKNNLVLDITPNKENKQLLWIGTETGLCLFNTETGTYETFNRENTKLSNEVIKCIYPDGDILWLGTDYGLNIINQKTRKTSVFYHNPIVNHSISNNVIWDIFQDSNNILWFITSNGISLLNIRTEFYKTHEVFYSDNKEQAGNQVRDMLVSGDSIFWMATIHGVIRKDLKTGKQRNFTVNSAGNSPILLDNVYCLGQDNQNRIWIGTAGGINIWDDQRSKMYSITADPSNGLKSNYISGFYFTEQGETFVSAWEGGLYKLTGNLKTLENIHFKSISNDGEAIGLAVTNDFYFISHNNVYHLPQNTETPELINLLSAPKLNTVIHCLNKDFENNIWLGGDGQLLKYTPNSDSFVRYHLVDENQKLISLEVDPSGIVWGAGAEQVFKFSPKTEESIFMPLNPNSPVKNFYTSSSLQSGNGKIYFGGNNGYVEIDIRQNNHSLKKPQTYISGLHLNNKEIYYDEDSRVLEKDIAFTHQLKLKYADNTLMLDFSTLDFWMPEKGIYRYRLTNYDKEWQITEGKKNFAVYSNLSPGKYIFEVTGSNHYGLWDDTPTRLNIKISPPIWLSKGFFVIYFLLVAGIIYGTLMLLNYRHRIAHELKIAQLEKIHSEQLLQAKQQFFTNISHEFRTPLSLIVPPLQQIIKSNNLDEIQKRLLALAGKNSQRLLRLVNQILDFRKLEITELKLISSRFELVSFCKNIHQSFTDLAERNEVDYRFITQISPCIVLFDEAKIETVLFNLLSNAFKHTPPGGKIILQLSKTHSGAKEQFEVSVSDSGKGIPKEEQENIFKRFYQTDNFNIPKTGTGIGLTMALEYAQLHKGTIRVDSTPRAGSLFTLVLPYQPATEEVILPDEILLLEEMTSNPNKKNPSSANKIHEKTILIIDDNPDILEYIELNLTMHYHFIKAENGKKGFEIAKKEMPDLIVSDVMMPVMDGLELCQKLKKTPQTATIPVILLTAKSLDAQKIEGMMTGADLYITKPFDTGYLYSCIESLFRRENVLQNYIRNELQIQAPDSSTPDDNQDQVFIRKVMDIIEKNIDNNHLSVNLISHEIGISSTHLYRKLMAITQQPTKDIIKNYRLQKAAHMLKNNEGNVTEVMYAVGFSSLSSFSKSFKIVYGYSPRQYQEQYLKTI